ncbi:Hsp20/alpha crystallin family protein [Ignisphaera sp. 4213-co]|uniref:Hsp20/alpha crystallin family protein n=1 Tax=Ignisphaera cupida TaxID=3050454 RepID=A0ABD4Z467_9CREN|nr:archaeal heat shock protein Hsp20 [Ignisphaera sp. 4213-co]MDK6027777.1 Hsp20/alpha crystallin family protein [Ignisphaera sp. 4213-co]
MSEPEERRGRRRRSIFDLFDDLFSELEEELNELERSFRIGLAPLDKSEFGKPIVYGFRIEIGPDGIPKIYEFGNVKRSGRGRPKVIVSEELEPLVDIYEEEDKIRVVLEMPGVDENKIKVEALDDRHIVVEGSNHDRKYKKEIELPTEVDVDSAEAVYKNGVLEIRLKKKKESKKGKIIRVVKEH